MTRLPVVYLPHGGGPWPWMPDQRKTYANMAAYMRGLPGILPEKPEAVLCVSAHWEQPVATVMSSPNPPMLYDYSGFPPETYEVTWPAPGAVALAGDIETALVNAGIRATSDARRGFDHGAFVPLALAYPDADVPTLQLSLVAGLDPEHHVRVGRVLESLRDRGVFIVGSGMSYHNLRTLFRFMTGSGTAPLDESVAFDDWLEESMALPADQRAARLVEWERAPSARECHPREEHLLPLHVIAGAAGNDAATMPYRDKLMGGVAVSSVHFGQGQP